MEQNTFTLLATIILAVLATIFTIIGVSTPGWPGNWQLFRCGYTCPYNYTAAGVLLLISIVLLAMAVVFTVMFWRGMISNASDKVKSIVLVFFVVAGILITIAYSRTMLSAYYSYHLAVTGGILAFLSSILFAFWFGRTSVPYVH